MAVFRSSLTSCFPGMLLTYFLNVFEIVPVAPIITGITFGFTFHMRCISTVRFLCCRIFSASYLITFLSPQIATSTNIDVAFSLSRILMSGLFIIIIKTTLRIKRKTILSTDRKYFQFLVDKTLCTHFIRCVLLYLFSYI